MVIDHVRRRREPSVLVFENVFLLQAPSAREALALARKIGRSEEVLDGLLLNGAPAQQRFAGVRKVVECLRFDPSASSVHKMEVTYSEIRLERRNLARYVKGLECRVWTK